MGTAKSYTDAASGTIGLLGSDGREARVKILVTGSAGHLGEGLLRTLKLAGRAAVGLDLKPSPYTDIVGSITDRDLVARSLVGVDAVIHAATLHKPHVATHTRQDFLDTNITGTLNLLEASSAAGVGAFLFTSTTSTFGMANRPGPTEPAAWVTEDVVPIPRNIYGTTKVAAEDLCELFHKDEGLNCLVLRTSRFFVEQDDDPVTREAFDDGNVKANEYLYRRVELSDVVDAHMLGLVRAPELGFGRYVISATTPFTPDDVAELRDNAPAVLERRVPAYAAEYARRGWQMFPSIDRVYDNERARRDLGWQPTYDFRHVLDRLIADQEPRSALSQDVGQSPITSSTSTTDPTPCADRTLVRNLG